VTATDPAADFLNFTATKQREIWAAILRDCDIHGWQPTPELVEERLKRVRRDIDKNHLELKPLAEMIVLRLWTGLLSKIEKSVF